MTWRKLTRWLSFGGIGFVIAVSLVNRAYAYANGDNIYWGGPSTSCTGCTATLEVQAWTTASGNGEPQPVAVEVSSPGCANGSWHEFFAYGANDGTYDYSETSVSISSGWCSGTTGWRPSFTHP